MSNDIAPRTDGDTRLDSEIGAALAHGQVIDITTTGRRSGEPRRIEIVFHNIDGRIYITGMPRRDTRAWLHNLRADPRFVFHLKRGVRADLPATAREITDQAERRAVFEWVVAHAWQQQDVEVMTRYSPLVEVVFEAAAA
jgi:deazaflavin-dependent oxidoreductase (nitroreductase family)